MDDGGGAGRERSQHYYSCSALFLVLSVLHLMYKFNLIGSLRVGKKQCCGVKCHWQLPAFSRCLRCLSCR